MRSRFSALRLLSECRQRLAWLCAGSLQEAEERRAAFVASLEAAREEGLREGLATVEEVEAEVRAAIDAVRTRRK